MTLILALIAAAVVLYLVLRAKAPLDIYRQFSLSAAQWTILGTDLGKGHPSKKLWAFGVAGEPDVIFRGKRTGQIAVGEFKNRNYKGYVRRREYYQVLLYIGLARVAYRENNVIGLLSYRDECIQVQFNEAVLRLWLASELRSRSHSKNGQAKDSRPLHKRMNVDPRNRKIRFPS